MDTTNCKEKEKQELLKLLEKYTKEPRFYGKNYPKIPFFFAHNARDFIVEELPLYPFSGTGEHAILKIRKKNIGTPECISAIANALEIPKKDIGYAGLKDKNALTYQYISVPYKAYSAREEKLHSLPQIKLIESNRHNNKIKIGHLQGNRFSIRLKKVAPQDFVRLKDEAKKAEKYGFPNFFGYQRFGNFGDNYMQALAIKKIPNKQKPLEKLLISSLQSVLFNLWLEERLKISTIMRDFSPKDSKKALFSEYGLGLDEEYLNLLHKADIGLMPLPGDVCMHYPHGKYFYFGDVKSGDTQSDTMQIQKQDIVRLEKADIGITGLLSGMDCRDFIKNNNASLEKQPNLKLAKGVALHIEKTYCHNIMAQGTRRYAWVYPYNVEMTYHAEQAQATMRFILPSGAYATTFLSYIKNGDVKD